MNLYHNNRLFTSYQYGFQKGSLLIQYLNLLIMLRVARMDPNSPLVPCYLVRALDCGVFHPGDKARVLRYKRDGSTWLTSYSKTVSLLQCTRVPGFGIRAGHIRAIVMYMCEAVCSWCYWIVVQIIAASQIFFYFNLSTI